MSGTADESVAVAAYRAAAALTAALATGNRELAATARAELDAAIDANRSTPDAATRAAVVRDDPVTAAAAGWLTLSALRERVAADPDDTLDADEAVAWHEEPTQGTLRLIVLGRVEGRSVAELRRAFPPKSSLGLAARGNPADARRLADLLRAQGILDDT